MLDAIEHETRNVIHTVIALLPDIAGALLLLLVGWLLARFLRMLTTRLIRSLNQLLAGRFSGTHLEFARIPAYMQELLASVVYWVTVLVFVAVAIRVIGFTGAALWLEKLVGYLPALLAGGLIIVGSIIVGSFTRKLVTHAAAAANIDQPQLLGQVSQFGFIVVGLVIGLGQIGVDVSFLIMLFGIVLTALLTAFALAFGLGARSLVENLIATQHIKHIIKPGQQVRCGALTGRVLEFTATAVMLETEDGQTLMPAKLCMEQSISVIIHEVNDEPH